MLDLTGKAEIQGTCGDKTWVRGPHCSERLANRTYGILSGAASDRLAACGDDAVAVSLQENLQDWDGVGDVLEEWVDGQRGAEVGPAMPVGIGGCGTGSGNSEANGMLSSAEVIQERRGGGGVQRRQECFCGYVELK